MHAHDKADTQATGSRCSRLLRHGLEAQVRAAQEQQSWPRPKRMVSVSLDFSGSDSVC